MIDTKIVSAAMDRKSSPVRINTSFPPIEKRIFRVL
jgi:hypothetical protein